jgi:hypothetical protein
MPLKRNEVLESDSANEETETDKQWTDNTQSEPCRGQKGALTSDHLAMKTNSSSSWLKVQNSDHQP